MSIGGSRRSFRAIRAASLLVVVAALLPAAFNAPALAQTDIPSSDATLSGAHVDLDQARNGTAASPTSPVDFQNGNAGTSNSHYVEGQSIPYRLVLDGIGVGPHVVEIEWDIRNGGKHALDFITHFDRLKPHGIFTPPHAAEVVDPLIGLSGPFDPPTTFPIPEPSSAGSPVGGQPGARFLTLPASERALTIWNGTISHVEYVTQGSLTSADASSRLRITLTASSSQVVIAWGGHLASRADWGDGNSAAAISGSAYHSRLIAVDGSGGNQDRSLQASCVMLAPVCDIPCSIDGPATVCPGGVATYAAPAGLASYAWSVTGSASIVGSSDGPTVQVMAAGSCGGAFTLSLGLTDARGCAQSCDLNPRIVDTTPPVLTCPANAVVECGRSTDPSATGMATATDGCGSAITITFGDAARVVKGTSAVMTGCAAGGTIDRTWTATDACGNASQCVQTIEIVDTTPPVLTCPANAVVECGQSTDPSATGMATATDNCGSAITITFGDAARLVKGTSTVMTGCSGGGGIERTWTATDACGNASQCVQLIEIVDTTPPVLTCPPNAVVQCGQSTDPSATGMATATDNCGSAITITFGDAARLVKGTSAVMTGCTAGAPIVRTWTATDACGNASQCVQLIEIVDTTPPVLTCPPNAVVECGQSTDPSATGTPTATDNCGSAITITFGDAERLMKGTTTVMTGCPGRPAIARTWTATDACGNASQCVQLIEIVDTTPPVLTCPPNAVVECGESTDPSATGTPTATDNCGSAITITFGDAERLVKGATTVMTGCPDGTIERTWTATDACGNTSHCIQTIEIVNTGPPCPRSPGFWYAQCDQSPTGKSKFNATQMAAIAALADQKVAIFDWPGGSDFTKLCETLSTSGSMDQRRQARRQFAAFLANVSVGELGYVARNGDVVSLGASTPVACSGVSATTIGAMLIEVDARLVALEGQSLADNAVRAAYSVIIACLDAINNGRAFPNVCPSTAVDNAPYAYEDRLAVGDDSGRLLGRPVPNPFMSLTRASFSVPTSGEPLHIGVYDIAGRLIVTLAQGETRAGRSEVTWNGRDASGATVRGGVYFIRARLGSTEQSVRVVYLRP